MSVDSKTYSDFLDSIVEKLTQSELLASNINSKYKIIYNKSNLLKNSKIKPFITTLEKCIQETQSIFDLSSDITILEADIQKKLILKANIKENQILEVDIEKKDISEKNIKEADIKKADIKEADIKKADIKEADIKKADIKEADIKEADIKKADIKEADIKKADIKEADIKKADIKKADIKKADIDEADIKKADIDEADIKKKQFLEKYSTEKNNIFFELYKSYKKLSLELNNINKQALTNFNSVLEFLDLNLNSEHNPEILNLENHTTKLKSQIINCISNLNFNLNIPLNPKFIKIVDNEPAVNKLKKFEKNIIGFHNEYISNYINLNNKISNIESELKALKSFFTKS
jgi:uncharacterized protein YjbI with pentapeptide repeats